MKKYIQSLRQEYFKPYAPWWGVTLVMPFVIVFDGVAPMMNHKLQPVFKPVAGLARSAQICYRNVFPNTEAGFYREMLFLVALGMGMLCLSGW